jgi:hypothetical protein
MINVAQIGAAMEEAINTGDDAAWIGVVGSLTPEQRQAVATALQAARQESDDVTG